MDESGYKWVGEFSEKRRSAYWCKCTHPGSSQSLNLLWDCSISGLKSFKPIIWIFEVKISNFRSFKLLIVYLSPKIDILSHVKCYKFTFYFYKLRSTPRITSKYFTLYIIIYLFIYLYMKWRSLVELRIFLNRTNLRKW